MSAGSSSPQRATSGETTDASDELVQLRLDLWSARDAAIGAVAQAGTLRARNRELEATVRQLRVEIDRLRHVEASRTFRIGSTVTKPLRAARRLLR